MQTSRGCSANMFTMQPQAKHHPTIVTKVLYSTHCSPLIRTHSVTVCYSCCCPLFISIFAANLSLLFLKLSVCDAEQLGLEGCKASVPVQSNNPHILNRITKDNLAYYSKWCSSIRMDNITGQIFI